jgi:hypothetical protein
MESVAQSQTLEWITAISTAAAAFGTLAAVLITLYFNVWRPSRKAPRLTLGFNDESQRRAIWDPNTHGRDVWWGLTLSVANARDRHTAHEVQVFVDIAANLDGTNPPPDSWTDRYVQLPLIWQFGGAPGGIGQQKTDIAPGLARKFYLVFIGDPNRVYHDVLWPPTQDPLERSSVVDLETGQEFGPDGTIDPNTEGVAGALARFPFQKEDVLWLYREREYRFRFTIVARDVDAVMYEALLQLNHEVMGARAGEYSGWHAIAPHWRVLTLLDAEKVHSRSS